MHKTVNPMNVQYIDTFLDTLSYYRWSFTAHCTLPTAHFTLHTAHCTLHTAHHILHTGPAQLIPGDPVGSINHLAPL